jgi:hypothetical protein
MTDKPTEAAPQPEKKPRKPRTPPQPEVEAVEDEIDPNDPWGGEKPPKHYVLHEGSTITLSGKDVKLRPLTDESVAAHGIKSVTGAQGMPCEQQQVVLKFKSPAAAFKFFDLCLHAQDEADEHIKSGGKTEWHSERMLELFAGEDAE